MRIAFRRNATATLPDGPKGLPVLGNQVEFMRDSLGFLSRIHREYGDLVRVPLLGRTAVGVFAPEHVREVTSAYGADVDITTHSGKELKHNIQGRGPLNASGSEHLYYRDTSRRAMTGKSLQSYHAVTSELTDRMLERWSVDAVVDLLPEISLLSRRIFKYYMFGRDIVAEDPELDDAVDMYISTMENTRRFVTASLISRDVPGISDGGTLRRKLALVDDRVSAIARGTQESRYYSLAEAMLDEFDRTGDRRDPTLARELMLQLYFAGISSVASSIVWTLLMLALHPQHCRLLIEELERVLGGATPTTEDMTQLPILDATLNETLRLYPGAAYEFKKTVGPLKLDRYELPSNYPIMLSPWVTQRSPSSFKDPELFQPERFAERQSPGPEGAFSPWGVGNRSCVGRVVARLALRIVVADILQRYRLDLVPQHIDANAGRWGIRLLPTPGVHVRVAVQDGDTGRSAAPVYGNIVGGVPGPAS
ncbi:MAG: cytochrome P450 [Actinomycetota bacterium]